MGVEFTGDRSLWKAAGNFRGQKKQAKNGRRYILMVRPNISSTQATSDASAVTLLGSNVFVRSCEPGLSSNSLSKEPGDGSDASAQHERSSRLHRKPIYNSPRGIVGFVLVLYQREECLHYRHWRVAASGAYPVHPVATTTYVLTAQFASGMVTRAVTISVL